MPFIDKKNEPAEYHSKISKKKEKELRKKGMRPFDVRYGVSFPKGGKIKVWAKNSDKAYIVGAREQEAVLMDPKSGGNAPSVRAWKNSIQPKTKMKRKNNPRFKAVKIEKTHPKTGKKFTQTVYKHSKYWWRH